MRFSDQQELTRRCLLNEIGIDIHNYRSDPGLLQRGMADADGRPEMPARVGEKMPVIADIQVSQMIAVPREHDCAMRFHPARHSCSSFVLEINPLHAARFVAVAGGRTGRKGSVQSRKIVFGQANIDGGQIVFQMPPSLAAGDWKNIVGASQNPGDGDLGSGGVGRNVAAMS